MITQPTDRLKLVFGPRLISVVFWSSAQIKWTSALRPNDSLVCVIAMEVSMAVRTGKASVTGFVVIANIDDSIVEDDDLIVDYI